MKKITFLILLITGSASLNLRAQCTQDATDFGNNASIPSYNISGEVSVTLNTDDTVTVNLGNDFSTATGPDVRIYFLNSDGASDAALINGVADDFENIEFGLLEAFSGAQSFTVPIPEGTNISNFDKVYFFCLEFQQFWDFGDIEEPFTGNNCEVLDVAEFEQQDFELFPNPAQTTVQVNKNAGASSRLAIYNTAGKMVMDRELEAGLGKESIDVSRLTSGVYFVTISNNQGIRTRKLIVQ